MHNLMDNSRLKGKDAQTIIAQQNIIAQSNLLVFKSHKILDNKERKPNKGSKYEKYVRVSTWWAHYIQTLET